ncbi:MAG: AbrB/MazE/SpoVT family DNA-binding domain-containing protein [Actinomycetota bacterium]|nr:AbrB/MazE/SpoVT family DNA-binding domain-containing protein [Actinomycetota bacterium]
MENSIKISTRGRITIPKKLRDQIKIKEGMYIRVYAEDGNLVLKPLLTSKDKRKLINYASKESRGNIGIARVRLMAKDLNLNMASQVRDIRETD